MLWWFCPLKRLFVFHWRSISRIPVWEFIRSLFTTENKLFHTKSNLWWVPYAYCWRTHFKAGCTFCLSNEKGWSQKLFGRSIDLLSPLKETYFKQNIAWCFPLKFSALYQKFKLCFCFSMEIFNPFNKVLCPLLIFEGGYL